MNNLYMYKISIRFDETLSKVKLEKLGAKVDEIFASKAIGRVDKSLESRIYYDNDSKCDFGHYDMWSAIDIILKTSSVLKHIKCAYWYDVLKNEKVDLLNGNN